METMQRRAVSLPHPPHPPPALAKFSFWNHLLFTVSPNSASPPPLGLTPKWLGLAWFGEGGCFAGSVSSQLCLKNTITNTIAATWRSVLCWKMRCEIYLRFLVFDKIESSHFNCSRLGVLLRAMETWAPCVVPFSPQTIMFHCAKYRLWFTISLSSILFRII